LLKHFLAALILISACISGPARAEDAAAPFDGDLQRLAEIPGTLRYLRGICGSNEGPKWRNEMQAPIDAETPSGDRRARMIAGFHPGYNGFPQAYRASLPAAGCPITNRNRPRWAISTRPGRRRGTMASMATAWRRPACSRRSPNWSEPTAKTRWRNSWKAFLSASATASFQRRWRGSNTAVIARSASDEAIHSFSLRGSLDCFAEPVIGRAFARPVGSQ